MPLPDLLARPARILGATLAAIARKYIGEGYVYGGSASSPGDWDCSSFVSFCLHEAGLSLPGGKWGGPGMPPSVHGPVVVDYVNWSGVTAVSSPQAGDLCCWVGLGGDGHIGIAVSGTQMVSALNPQVGVAQTPILGAGPSGSPLVYRRLNGVAAGQALVTPGSGGSGNPAAALAAVMLLFGGVFALAVLAAAGVAAGSVYVARKAVT
jgi:NlpC/P60 family protein